MSSNELYDDDHSKLRRNDSDNDRGEHRNDGDNDRGEHRNDGDDDGNELHSDEDTITLLYDTVFNRAPDAQGLAAWATELAKTGTELDDIAELFMQSQEFSVRYGQNLSDDDYIEALYENTLGRPSDDVGKAHWVGQLDSGVSRNGILTDFSESAEHVNQILSNGGSSTGSSNDHDRGEHRNDGDDDGNELHSDEDTITLLYDTVFNRAPDAQGLAAWATELAKTGTELDDIAELFMQSQEFSVRYGQNLSDDDYIEALYENTLGRPSDDVGKAHWVGQLDSGVSRNGILTDFSESAEHVTLVLTGISAIPDVAIG